MQLLVHREFSFVLRCELNFVATAYCENRDYSLSAARKPAFLASSSLMYLPSLVLPYQRVPGLWYTPESVLTQTEPAWLAGGAGRGAAALVEVEAELDFAAPVEDAGVLAVGVG